MKAAKSNLYGEKCEYNNGVSQCLGDWRCGNDEPTCVNLKTTSAGCKESGLKKNIVCDGEDYRAEIVPDGDNGCHLQCDYHENNNTLKILVCGGILLFLLIFFIWWLTKPTPAHA